MRPLSILVLVLVATTAHSQGSALGPTQSSQAISILGDELYLHGGSRTDSFLESNCTSDLWRLRLGRQEAWNLTDALWEVVPRKEILITPPPVAGMGLRTLNVPANHTSVDSSFASNISPYLIEFGRPGCADEDTSDQQPKVIGFSIYNPVMNTWELMDLNSTSTVSIDNIDPAVLSAGNWLAPTTAVDYTHLAWYIILQSTVPLRQVILRKDVSALTEFMGKIDLREDIYTMFPTDLLYEDWTLLSVLNETAPFVDKGVATVVKEGIVILSGTANSFTKGDADLGELRGCDHAFIFSFTTNTWQRQNLTASQDGSYPDTREKAAFISVGNKIFMHGGVKPFQTVLNDLWLLDTDTWTWTRGPDGPGPRADHTLLLYHEYIFAVSGFDLGRNIPVVSTLPIMAYNTNTSSWTSTLRSTLDKETSYITNVTRVAIIIGTMAVAAATLFIATSTHFLRKWNQRNYTKVDEAYQLEQQQRHQELPSILKKRYQMESSNSRSGRPKGLQAEVIFEDVEETEDEEDGDEDEDSDYGGDEGSLLAHTQANPTSSRLGVGPRERVLEEEDEDLDSEHSHVLVRFEPGMDEREE